MSCSLCQHGSWISTPHCKVTFNYQSDTLSVIPKKHAHDFSLLTDEERADMKYCVAAARRLYQEAVGSFREAIYVSKKGHLYCSIRPAQVQYSSLSQKWKELAANWYDQCQPELKRVGKSAHL